MKDVPLLPLSNRFANFSITPQNEDTVHVSKSVTETANRQDASPKETLKSPSMRMKCWERRLPKTYVVAANPSPNSLNLKVGIQTMDTAEVKGVTALLDSGATGLFIDSDFLAAEKLTTGSLMLPTPVYNVDGTPNEAGSIHSVVDLILQYQNHSECAIFTVTNLGKHKMILGYPWLRDHNPKVDWRTQQVILNQCPAKCHTCRAKVHQEQQEAAKV